MNYFPLLSTLTKLPKRLGPSEREASQSIRNYLRQLRLPFVVQSFVSQTPKYRSYQLTADGQDVPCLPCGLTSGEIRGTDYLVSSLISSQPLISTPHLNFNPRTDTICLCNFSFAPALAVSRRDILQLLRARSVVGKLSVEPETYTSNNLLVGDITRPRTIIIAHYDAYFAGATDNASGVAVVAEWLNQKSLPKNTLVVFAGNEELSYDYPIYWGRGYRELDRLNPGLLRGAQQIIVVDSIGDGPPQLITDEKLRTLAFPINDTKVTARTIILTGNFDALMNVYHSPDDTRQRLRTEYLEATVRCLNQLVDRPLFVDSASR